MSAADVINTVIDNVIITVNVIPAMVIIVLKHVSSKITQCYFTVSL
jgi:hypothetical protein